MTLRTFGTLVGRPQGTVVEKCTSRPSETLKVKSFLWASMCWCSEHVRMVVFSGQFNMRKVGTRECVLGWRSELRMVCSQALAQSIVLEETPNQQLWDGGAEG